MEGKIVQKIDAGRSAPRCRFQLSHDVGEANFPIQFQMGHTKAYYEMSTKNGSERDGCQVMREMNGEDKTFVLLQLR